MVEYYHYLNIHIYVVSLIFRFFETTILFKSTESNEIAYFDE